MIDEAVDSSPQRRTLFNLSNGYLGLRGSLEEDDDIADQAFANGFHETWPITYPEDAYGLARVGQTIQPVMNPTGFRLRVDGVRFDPHRAELRDYRRRLDFATGVLSREFVWSVGDGLEVTLASARLVSFAERGVVAARYSVTVSRACTVELTNCLVFPGEPSTGTALRHGDRGTVRLSHSAAASPAAECDNRTVPLSPPVPLSDDPRRATRLRDRVHVIEAELEPEFGVIVATTNSALSLACAVTHRVECPAMTQERALLDADRLCKVVTADLAAGQTLRLTALACVDVTLEGARATLARLGDGAAGGAGAGGCPCDRAGGGADTGGGPSDPAAGGADTGGRPSDPAAGGADTGGRPSDPAAGGADAWDSLVDAQRAFLAKWWEAADVVVEAPGDLQGRVRWNLFQTIQATARADGLGIAAKGVSGSGYDGHYFWDGEAMVLPCLTYTRPELARHALTYRAATLDQARARARELHLEGAAFPWRTIDGREASAFFEAGTAQFHVSADIAYAVDRYLRATEDLAFLAGSGVDLLVETARLWLALGFFGRDGAFHIHGVTGPDEYSALVDDNLYTNVMAAANLGAANRWLDVLADRAPVAFREASERLGITAQERAEWERAAGEMVVPFDADLGVHAQDADFLTHPVWDFSGTPADHYPLLLHYHPLTLYRHQVLKQADVVLALITRPDLFSAPEKRADFDYYDPLTTGDSTLSAAAQAIVAAEVGHPDKALAYFLAGLNADLADSHGNAGEGVHVAAAASVWASLVFGFGGLRDWGGWSLAPKLPATWRGLTFRLRRRDGVVRVEIRADVTTLSLVSGESVDLTVDGQAVRLTEGAPTRWVPTARPTA